MSDSKKRSRSRNETKVAFQNLDIPQGLSDKERLLRAQAAEAVRSSIADLVVEKASQAITAASLANQKALSAVNEELMTKLELLKSIKANIDLEVKDLERLYGAHVVVEHLDVLKAEHDEAKDKMEKDITEVRAKWDEERVSVQRGREREESRYAYNLIQAQKSDSDKWYEEVRTRQNAERDRSEAFEKTCKAREEALAKSEKELTDLRAAVQAHQAEIDKAVKSVLAIESNRMTKEHHHQTELLVQSKISQQALFDIEKKALAEQLAAFKKLNDELTVSLSQAHLKNAEIATKALEASSGQAALSAVQNFAKDQGSNGPAKRS